MSVVVEQLNSKMESMEQFATVDELKASLPSVMMYRGHFKALATEQLNGEVFLGVATGNIHNINVVGSKKDAGSTGIMVISNKRVIFITKLLWMTKVESVGWSKFDSYSAQKGLMFGELAVTSTGGHEFKVTSIDKKVWSKAKAVLDEIML